MQTKYILNVVYWIIFISLVIVAIFFVHDVWQNYQEGATSIQITSKITKLLESPTITLCFNPGSKISVLQKYNINPNHFAGKMHLDKYKSFLARINESTIINIGIDFNLTLIYQYGKMKGTYNIFDKNLKKSYSDKIEFEEIYTIISQGLCFELLPNMQLQKLRLHICM